MNCKVVQDTYGKDLEMYAYNEWNMQINPDSEYANDRDDDTQMIGVLQCFCAGEKAEHGIKTMDMEYTYSNKVAPAPICKQYVEDNYLSIFYNQVASYSIVIINYVLRLFIIKLIIYIGKDTESEQTRLITNGVFIV